MPALVIGSASLSMARCMIGRSCFSSEVTRPRFWVGEEVADIPGNFGPVPRIVISFSSPFWSSAAVRNLPARPAICLMSDTGRVLSVCPSRRYIVSNIMRLILLKHGSVLKLQ